ncbi:MAG: VWA domain-containing protein [Clostridia bacterium]|nr:VWA domain-containing protein [Clostridia bacterium]
MAQTRESFLQVQGFENDGSERLPICFCLDTSTSMTRVDGGVPTGETFWRDGRKWTVVRGGENSPLVELKEGINLFLRKIRNDAIASKAAELSIVTFDSYAKSILDFCPLSELDENITSSISADGETYMGEGLNMALDKLESCVEKYKSFGIGCYSPWLIVMSDGQPNGSSYELSAAKEKIQRMRRENGLVVIPIGIGKEADMKALSSLSPNRNAVSIHNIDFANLFNNMALYIRGIAKTTIGARVNIDIEKISSKQINETEIDQSDTVEIPFGFMSDAFDFMDDD